MDLTPPTLSGRFVKLEPLRAEHAKELWEAAREPEIWRYMYFPVNTPADLDRWVALRLEDARTNHAMPLVQRDARTGQAFGSTSIFDISVPHRRMEVGHTWLGASHRRTAANTEAKLLVLTHCFEHMGALRVQLKTDARNARSRAAIERIGAQFEGVLRKHMVLADGTERDSAYYSIIAPEWPAVKASLLSFLENRG